MRIPRFILFCTLIATLLTIGAGCSSEDAVRSRLWVVEINENETLTSDVVGDGGVIFEDEVTLRIQSDPLGSAVAVQPGGPYSFVTIERYEVRFDADEEIEGFSAGLGWTVETGTFVTGPLTVVPASRKLEAPLIGLVDGLGQILATAHITFYGREADSGNEIQFEVSFPVHFANWTG